MTRRTAAARYARALLDVSLREAPAQDVVHVERELADFVGLFRQHPPLEEVLLNPFVPVSKKQSIVSDLVSRIGVSAVLRKLLLLLAGRDRLMLLPDLLASYRERLMDHLNVVRAEVTTTLPLTPQTTQAIERSLEQLAGRHVSLTTRVDAAIIGGMIARVGGTVYDGSIARQLARMRTRLAERS